MENLNSDTIKNKNFNEFTNDEVKDSYLRLVGNTIYQTKVINDIKHGFPLEINWLGKILLKLVLK